MTNKRERHPLAGRTIILKSNDPKLDGEKFWVEEWYVNMGGTTVLDDIDNVAAMIYRLRRSDCGLPFDDNYVYGKIGSMGFIVHVTELGDVTDDPEKYSYYNRSNENENEA